MNKQDAINWAGSGKALADKLGITQSAVSQWTEIPELQQYKLAVLSGGALTIDQFAPIEPAAEDPEVPSESAVPEPRKIRALEQENAELKELLVEALLKVHAMRKSKSRS